MKTQKKSLAVEAALAGLLAAAVASPARAGHHEKAAKGEAPKADAAPSMKASKGKVNCYGVNACKGTSECGVSGKHACAGMNACKGQGWIGLTKKVCLKYKGSLEEPKTETAPAPGKKG